jgi:hypothetical protein
MSAATIGFDTFKVCKVLIFPGESTNLAILGLQDRGAIIIDISNIKILADFDLRALNPFPEQSQQY